MSAMMQYDIGRTEISKRRKEQEQAEQDRVSAIQGAIAEIEKIAAGCAGKNPNLIRLGLRLVEGMPINAEIYMEYLPQAIAARNAALEQINAHLLEAEENRIKPPKGK